MDGLLPKADVLCVLRYEPDVDLSTGQGVRGERDLKTVIEKMMNKSQPEKSQETPVLPAATRYYRPPGTTGQLPEFASVRGPAVTRK